MTRLRNAVRNTLSETVSTTESPAAKYPEKKIEEIAEAQQKLCGASFPGINMASHYFFDEKKH